MAERQLKLGAILSGVGTTQNGWRHPDLPGDASVNIDWFIENAQKAEAAKFDLVFIVDSPYITPDSAPHFLNRLEPLTLLSAVATATKRIGLVATLTTSYTEPFNVARQFGSLDLISRGRAGWNVVTTGLEGAAGNYGLEQHIDHSVRYRRAAEHLSVVQGLWDSYEDDAFPRDKGSGVFLDKSKLHPLNHRGEFFSVSGPLNISRSPQGQPVIFQAGTSEDGRDLAARFASGIYANEETFEEAQEYYQDIKRRAVAHGREPDEILIFPGLVPIIADTDEQARSREEEINGKLDLKKALVQLGRPFNYHDFTQYPLDEPFPELGDLGQNGYRGGAERIKRVAREGQLTLRETAWRFAARRSPFVGSPLTVANEMERWFREGAVDGFNFRVSNPRDFDDFLQRVLPLLRERGLIRRDYEHSTLRGHLGLPIPENRHTRARTASAPEPPRRGDAVRSVGSSGVPLSGDVE
ncbi:MAG TPA: LLM class flavin-dependent oxidoreductase [Polyangiaceae bacterium]|nr:LLM class flavin-dependent oxidoreductase [Polyangiaceae bacterium]